MTAPPRAVAPLLGAVARPWGAVTALRWGALIARLRAVASLLREQPWPVLIAVTVAGWAALIAFRHATVMAGLCGETGGVQVGAGLYAVQAALLFMPVRSMAGSWLLMLVAMMTPILAGPLFHLWASSLRRRRWRAIGLFLAGYLAIWMAMAPILMLAGVTLRVMAAAVAVPGGVAALALAYLWQATPWQQRCLNRCHWTPRIGAFGLAADGDCLRFGVANALWCVGTCWALMLASLAAQGAHLAVMAGGAAVMIAERLRPGRPARWHLPWLGRLPAPGRMLSPARMAAVGRAPARWPSPVDAPERSGARPGPAATA